MFMAVIVVVMLACCCSTYYYSRCCRCCCSCWCYFPVIPLSLETDEVGNESTKSVVAGAVAAVDATAAFKDDIH